MLLKKLPMDDIAASQIHSDSIHRIDEEIRRDTRRLYSRLKSISDDAEFIQDIAKLIPDYPVIANERCGAWYVDPQLASSQTVYFKSTDGHSGHWKFSLRRANTHLFRVLEKKQGCIIVDSTKRGKSMPDSFSRTIPIWCAVWNMVIAKFDCDCTNLNLPPSVVSNSERDRIEQTLPKFVDALKGSGIDVAGITAGIAKPLRPIWITKDQQLLSLDDTWSFKDACFTPIVCVVASSSSTNTLANGSSWYIQGAADDHETWANGLTAQLFWRHKEQLLSSKEDCEQTAIEIVRGSDKKLPRAIDRGEHYNFIGDTSIAVGDVAAGRPPECWSAFDVVINCGAAEYEPNKTSTRYLYLPMPKGKRGQVELGKAIPVALEFARPFVKDNSKKILIHGQQGADQSVGIALAILVQYFGNNSQDVTKESIKSQLLWITTSRAKVRIP